MKRRMLWLDFESKSLLNIKDVGLDRYAKDPSTAVLMLAWAFDDAEPSLWQPRLGPMPPELLEAIQDPSTILCAWNYNFERDILEYVLGLPTDQKRWYDPSVRCAYMSLPIGLHRAGDALSLHGKKIHIIGDQRPVKLFSQPSRHTKTFLKNNPDAESLFFKDWETNPADWEIFCQYCKQDVVAEREVHKAVLTFNSPMTNEEKRAWYLDQRMNEAGVYIDLPFVVNAKNYAEEETNQIVTEMQKLTGLQKPGAWQQLVPWLQERKYPYTSADKAHIEEGLKLPFLSDEVRYVLELKQKLGGSAHTKFQSILDRVGPDGRLRDQFVYHGAHTARWSGRGVQLQNLFKAIKSVSTVCDQVTVAIRENKLDIQQIVADYNAGIDKYNAENPDKTPEKKLKKFTLMQAVAGTVRSSFRAAPGKKLLVGDLAQIESRVLAALAGCQQMIDAYASGADLYCDFMTWFLKREITKKDTEERARGKIVLLGCGFGMGWEKFVAYAATFGITLTEKEAKEAVYGFREKYPEIVSFWSELDKAVKTAIKVKINVHVRGLVVDGRDERMLKIWLPSGRALHYLDPRVVTEPHHWKPNATQESVEYTAFDEKGIQTKRLYGGLLAENVVQAVARDLLLNGMFEAEKKGMTVIMTIHDEVVTEVGIEEFVHEDLLNCMRIVPEWGEGMGFVLAAEGYEGSYYRK
jgi:DNA polymerase bacteriophage-type